MPKPHHIAIPIFPNLQSLDAVGPGQVFGSANQLLTREAYRIRFVATAPGPVATTAGFSLTADSLRSVPATSIDTLIVPGGDDKGVREALADKQFMRWLKAAALNSTRACSVCSGAFLLAATGVLDGRNAATHWSATANLQRAFPKLRVDEQSIYVNDGKYWTSAGVTTGIDMSLALLEADHGRDVATAVARQLVVYMRRPGHQTQFSATLNAQSATDDRLATLAGWIEANLHKPLDVETLAGRAAMSPRSFHRNVRKELGVSPARFVEAIRLDAARRLLDARTFDLAQIAERAGFSGPDHLIRAFGRRFGVTPAAYRQMHGA
ncbi:MAG: GlxA family transcriptional regulator [Alphaproteobacteria bacterium]|nr:GlxA family transcriptional regulator [Alphaproteobacteria bacterium]